MGHYPQLSRYRWEGIFGADFTLVISAGNRPYWFGGLIAMTSRAEQPLLKALEEPVEGSEPEPPFPPLAPENLGQGQIDLRTPYLEHLRNAIDLDMIRRSALTMFVDAMNGTASGLIPGVFGEGTQAKAVEINRETDALFGRQPPQPTEVGLQRLRKLVRESESHLGVAVAADGRALAVADHTGELVTPLDLALLLAQYLSSQHRQRGLVVAPGGGTAPNGGLKLWEERTGLRVELAAEPAERIAEITERDPSVLLVGVTGAGEVTIGRFGATPDATLTALMLTEIVARYGDKLRALVEKARGTS